MDRSVGLPAGIPPAGRRRRQQSSSIDWFAVRSPWSLHHTQCMNTLMIEEEMDGSSIRPESCSRMGATLIDLRACMIFIAVPFGFYLVISNQRLKSDENKLQNRPVYLEIVGTACMRACVAWVRTAEDHMDLQWTKRNVRVHLQRWACQSVWS